jgi:hypothetical protein
MVLVVGSMDSFAENMGPVNQKYKYKIVDASTTGRCKAPRCTRGVLHWKIAVL